MTNSAYKIRKLNDKLKDRDASIKILERVLKKKRTYFVLRPSEIKFLISFVILCWHLAIPSNKYRLRAILKKFVMTLPQTSHKFYLDQLKRK